MRLNYVSLSNVLERKQKSQVYKIHDKRTAWIPMLTSKFETNVNVFTVYEVSNC